MFAIFEAKGKQWRAEEGDTLRLPSLDADPGDEVVFDRVLLARRDDDVLVGRPVVGNASVSVEVTRHGKGDKVIVFKRKKRKNYRRKYGHRQPFTEVRVVEIDLEGASVAVGAEEGPEEIDEAPEEVDATSAAEELAAEHGVDLAGVEGTGKDGRVLKSDVQAAVDEAEETAPAEEEDEAEDRDAGPGIPEDVDITGAARELALEHGVDVARIEGTGKDGRILKSDVQEAIDSREEE